MKAQEITKFKVNRSLIVFGVIMAIVFGYLVNAFTLRFLMQPLLGWLLISSLYIYTGNDKTRIKFAGIDCPRALKELIEERLG